MQRDKKKSRKNTLHKGYKFHWLSKSILSPTPTDCLQVINQLQIIRISTHYTYREHPSTEPVSPIHLQLLGNERNIKSTTIALSLECKNLPHGVRMITRKVVDVPKTTREELGNDLKPVETSVTKSTVNNNPIL